MKRRLTIFATAAALIIGAYWVYAVYRDRSDTIFVGTTAGTPVQGATVSILSPMNEYRRLEATTGETGMAAFPGDLWHYESLVSVKVTKDGEVVFDEMVSAPRFGPIQITVNGQGQATD